jgi:hypothetical protein
VVRPQRGRPRVPAQTLRKALRLRR